MKIRILFIGSFLSRSKGTKGIAEKLEPILSDQFELAYTSRHVNRFFRSIDIIVSTLFSSADVYHIDIFSGRSFYVGYYAFLIGRLRNRQIVVNFRGGKLIEFYAHNKRKVKQLFRHSQRLLTPSLFLQNTFKQEGIYLEYLPNGIDVGHFSRHNSKGNDNTLIWIRAFTKVYNPLLAINAINIVRQKYPDIKLLMIGPDKGLLHECLEVIEDKGLKQYIEIVGPVENSALIEYLNESTIFLNTTSYETFGTAVMEAAAAGVPIVSTPAGEIPLLWQNGKEIMITKDWSPESMAENIMLLLEQSELRKTLYINARLKAEKFSWENIILRWRDIFASNKK